jgi:hypothetical protein
MRLRALKGNDWEFRAARCGFPILVEYAKRGQTITYGEWDHEIVRRRLEKHRFHPEYGKPAGLIGNACHEYAKEIERNVPEINLIVINKTTKIPGRGANYYIERFCKTTLKKTIDAEDLLLADKKAIISRAHEEIFAFDGWDRMLKAYRLKAARKLLYAPLVSRQLLGVRGRLGGVPEGPSHKALKLRIADDPALVGVKGVPTGDIEYKLISGDEIDVHFKRAALGVEVKGRGAGTAEQLRGIFQCVKYRALLRAEQIAQRETPNADCVLALGDSLDRSLLRLAAAFGVRVYASLAS